MKWTFSTSRRIAEFNLQNGYASLARDLTAVQKFLSQNGIKENQIIITPVFMEQMYYDSNYQGPREVTLRQMITVSSQDVDGITRLAKNTDVLTQAGILLTPINQNTIILNLQIFVFLCFLMRLGCQGSC